jgi:hypothetical protein
MAVMLGRILKTNICHCGPHTPAREQLYPLSCKLTDVHWYQEKAHKYTEITLCIHNDLHVSVKWPSSQM